MSHLKCVECGDTEQKYTDRAASRNEVPDEFWYDFGDKKLCSECLERFLVEDLSSLQLVEVTEAHKKELADLDRQINKWSVNKFLLGNLCDFCYTLDNTCCKLYDGRLDNGGYYSIRICDDCHANYEAVVDKLFADGKSEWMWGGQQTTYTKDELLKLKETYTYDEEENFEGMADCSPVDRHHLIPQCANILGTIAMYEELDCYGICDSHSDPVNVKEWVFLTQEPEDWYHGHTDIVLAFNCSKERFGDICTIVCQDTGYSFSDIGHYYDYVQARIEHSLTKSEFTDQYKSTYEIEFSDSSADSDSVVCIGV